MSYRPEFVAALRLFARVSEAMKALLDFRQHAAQALTEEAPVVPVKKGFLQWLRKRGL